MADIPPGGAPRPATDLTRTAALLLLSALIFGFYWKLWSGQYTWLSGDDLSRQVLPWLQFQAGEWQAGRFPAWDPNLWLGQPLVGQAQPGALYPLNWLLFLTPARHGWLKEFYLNLYTVTIHWMAALFAYLLARSLARSRLASLLCGLAYALSGWMGTTDWPQMRNGAVWAPLVLLFVLRMNQGGPLWRNACFGGFFLGVSWLSGHHQQPVFISLMSGALLCWNLWRNRNHWVRPASATVLFFAVALLTGAAQILPAQEYGREAIRWVGAPEPAGWETKVPYEVHKQFSLYPDSLLGIIFPTVHVHSDPHIGIALLSLAIVGVLTAWSSPATRLLAATGVGALFYSLAHFGGIQAWIYHFLPIVDKARSPSMAVSLFGLASAALAAYGVDAVLSHARTMGFVRMLIRFLLALAVVVFAARVVSVVLNAQAPPGHNEIMYTAFVSLLVAAALAGWAKGALSSRATAVLLIALFLTEVGNVNGAHLAPSIDQDRTRGLRQMSELGDIADFLRRQPGPVRVVVDDTEIPHNFGDYYGIHQVNGYLASITRNLDRVELHAPHMKRLAGIAYAIRKEPDAFHSEEVFRGRSGFKVFRAAGVLPRAFIVHEAIRLQDRRDGPRLAHDLGHRLSSTTFLLTGPPPLATCDSTADRAVVTAYLPAEVRIAATTGCRGILVLSDTYFPGWEARIDGRPVPILEPYGFLRGVVLEAGAHQIEFSYRPRSLRIGSTLSILSLVLIIALWISGRLRQSA